MFLAEATYILNTAVALFVIVDPFALIPVYLTLTERFDKLERRHIRRKATTIAALILVFFALTGLGLFRLFSITMPAFQIAGGILLLVFGLTQLNQQRVRVTPKETEEGLHRDDISIFPLATPLLAGPGAISTVVLFSSQATTPLRTLNLLIAIVMVLSAAHFLLRLAPVLYRFLGRTGLNLITRIMGIIICAIAVQFMINGIRTAFNL